LTLQMFFCGNTSAYFAEFGGTEGLRYLRNGEQAIRAGTKADDIRAFIRDEVSRAVPISCLKELCLRRQFVGQREKNIQLVTASMSSPLT